MSNSPLFLSFRNVFFYVGYWSLKPSKIYKAYSYLIILAALYAAVGFVIELKNAKDITELAFMFGAILTLVVNISKILISRTRRFQSLLAEMFQQDEYMSSISRDNIRNIYVNNTKEPLKIVNFYRMTMVCTLILNILISIIVYLKTMGADSSQEKPLPYAFMVPFDKKENYLMTHLYLDLIAIMVGVIVVSGDFLVLAPILYLNCRLKTLKFVLEHPRIYLRNDGSHQGENYYEIMRNCVMEHSAIIEDLRNFNSITMFLILCDFLFHSSQIAAFVVSIIASETVMTLGNTFNLACGMFVFFQLFIVYWQGQILIDESGTIGLSIYQSCWYEVDCKTRKLLILMIIRSHKPLALTVGPFFPVNLELFLKIVKTVYSISTIFFRQ